MANKDQWMEMQAILQDRTAPTEWIKVPSHTGLHGNEMADGLADQGVRMYRVKMEGHDRPTLKRPADWDRDREDQESGTQGLASPVAAPQAPPLAAPLFRTSTWRCSCCSISSVRSHCVTP